MKSVLWKAPSLEMLNEEKTALAAAMSNHARHRKALKISYSPLLIHD